ncbi:subtilase family protein [Kribbella amoyensis]|uniref:Subtilase family protein n=1 Tax=Kribbella amoyensis TaxID=996641 RepID=A0A561BV59_9ACTN|nr:S8 family serine peptidase [Kribbella amoyensis]TWD82794.1 subtilase family protein [Kribbella amoyensis]
MASLLAVPLPTQAAQPVPESRQITLITGDQVVLEGGDSDRLSILPGPGREQISFEARRTAGEWTVIPSDVRAELRNGRLDRRLFDLEMLLRDGYDDSRRADIPVIVTGASVQSRDAKAIRDLGASTALVVPKSKAKGVLTELLGEKTGRDAGGSKIWLDRKLRTTLDKSVPQIGAPAAWQAGYTGRGVKVAVLDSGIDDKHPDLTGQVIARQNFTTDPATDVAGHGTHVASTIAGKGTDGYRGVAPDAKLLDGKVCDDVGDCNESNVLAGIEWAVQHRAQVVNLSLGGDPTDGTDPVEDAMERYGNDVLFVVAAGNQSGDGTIGSPGTASAALTVGAVDRDENLADFSSQGPAHGGAIKPDVTAPGVGIVAARSGASQPQEPVGDNYARMSGTSMATPHVAGAAALLAQQHAGWKAPELKSALTSAAQANPALTAYQQGAGRVDVARAIKQVVQAKTVSLAFGTAIWPHADDRPVTREAVFRNLGTASVTLDLKSELTIAGKAAPASALKLSADRLTVPAGGEASVQVVSDTTHSGPDGVYSGRITATTGEQQIVVPLVVDKEVESYDVALKTLDENGEPAARNRTFVSFTNLTDGESEGGVTPTTRLPRGKYLLDATMFGAEGQHYRLVQPEFVVTGNRSVVVDARKTEPVKVSVPRKDASGFVAFFGYERRLADGGSIKTFNLQPKIEKLSLGRIGGPVPPKDFTAFVVSYLGRVGEDGTLAGSPYVYGLVDTSPGRFFDGLDRKVQSDRQLAHVVAKYNGPPDVETSWRLATRDTMPIGVSVRLPTKLDQYLEPRTPWQQAFADQTNPPRTYPAGRTTEEAFNYKEG